MSPCCRGSICLSAPLVASTISVGDHPTVKLGPLTIDIDTVWATLIAGMVVILLGLIMVSKTRKAGNGVPGKFQLCWEMLVGAVQKQVDDSIGPRGAKVVPLALTLFIFIFTCNLFEVVAIGSRFEVLPAPTSDINLPLAMALYVIVLVHTGGHPEPGGGRLLQALRDPPVRGRRRSTRSTSS